MKLLITGNPIQGFKFFGPFNTVDEALEWEDKYWAANVDADMETDWWVTDLRHPGETMAAVMAAITGERK